MENILDTAKEKLSAISDNIHNLLNTEVIAGLKDYGIEKINETWAQIESSSAIFQKTGYSITAINIDLSIPPSITLELDQIENISDDEEEKLLEENKDKQLIYLVLVALFKANAIQKSINSVQYKFSGLTIGMGLTPNIEMKFKKIA